MDLRKLKTHLQDHLKILKAHRDQADRQRLSLERSIEGLDKKIKECTELLKSAEPEEDSE